MKAFHDKKYLKTLFLYGILQIDKREKKQEGGSLNLKNGIKTLAMWLIIGVIFIVVLSSIMENSDSKLKYSELITNIIKTREDLKKANRNFEYAQDDLIDYYIYEMKANQAKLNYLIKMAKMKGITVDMINDIKYRLSSDEEVG